MATPLTGGHWITIHGNHVYIKGAALDISHVESAAKAAGLSDAATAALHHAHQQGLLPTDQQTYGAINHITNQTAMGFDENYAVQQALQQHGGTGLANSVAVGATVAKTAVWKHNALGKKLGTHVGVLTHGAPVTAQEVDDYAGYFGLDASGKKALQAAFQQGLVKNDTHLAQLVGDAIHVAKAGGPGQGAAITAMLNGHSATQIIAGHQSASAAPPVVTPPAPVPAAPPSTSPSVPPAASYLVSPQSPPIQSAGPLDKSHFAGIADVDVGEGPLPPLKSGQTRSAGILIVEPDGKIRVYEPKGHFGGYEHTFSKGGLETGLSLQQSAHKELYEELGLTAQITGVLGDFDSPNTSTRFYIGVRTGGDPADAVKGLTPAHNETDAVKLVTFLEAKGLLNKKRDQDVLAALKAHVSKNVLATGTTQPAASPPTPVSSPATQSPAAPAAAVSASAAPVQHHVTIQGKKFDLDYSKPVSASDVDALKGQLKVSANGENFLKSAIANGTITNHGQMMEKAAMGQASSNQQGFSSLNNHGLSATAHYAGIEGLLDAAHKGDTLAQKIEQKLGAHSFSSPAQAKSQVRSQQAAQAATSFAKASPADHTFKQVGGQAGSNTGALYELPDGTRNYVKTLPAAAAQNEHLANAIYNALGVPAPQSKVFSDGGKTRYASLIVPNKGDLHTLGVSRETAEKLLQGFAADVLLGNHDVLGNNPSSNVVIGHDGTPHRIDNGGALLFRAMGANKPSAVLSSLNEWKGFADPKVNPGYAKLFQAAGVKDAASIPNIGAQIKTIRDLRDSHGGWSGFIAQAAPDMPAAQQAETAKLLEERTALLERKLQSTPGANSTVGTRTFAFSTNPADVRSQLKDWHAQHGVKMTPAQVEAMRSHQGSGYQQAAAILLKGQNPDPKVLAHIKALDTYFAQPGVQLGHDVALSRSIPMGKDEVDKLRKLQPGAVIGNTPVNQSTSTNSQVAVSGDDVQLCILAPKETPGVPLNAYAKTSGMHGEAEVLLPRGLSYRVIAVLNPGDSDPAEVPKGWTWRDNAKNKGVRLVIEPIIAGVNDPESATVPVHHINQKEIEKGQTKLVKTPNLGNMANIDALPTPNLSGIAQPAPWNKPIKP